MKILITLKIGRHEYTITSIDRFMDNGLSVLLMTQGKGNPDWGQRPRPVLSQRAVKEISVFTRVQHKHEYASKVTIFSIAPNK